ncbi:MAG: hypothetical protein FJW23_11695, partial [Acidimicrobiia bacterium]|nr:hypothetical protein [Acidimicrobiia bacterium]
GGRARLVGAVGRDGAGVRLVDALPAAVERGGLVRPAGFATAVKTRILAGGVHSAKQQVVRIDRPGTRPIDARTRVAIERKALRAAEVSHAVLVSDYGSGLVTPALVGRLRAMARTRGIPILLDTRYRLLDYRGLTLCAPNESEVEQALGVRIGDDLRALERAGRALLAATRASAVLITRGSRGMALFEPARRTVHIPIHGSDEIADVTGAGDTVIAALALALAAGATCEAAARLANYAGGIVVMKRGTATVSAEEMRAAVGADDAAAGRSGRDASRG